MRTRQVRVLSSGSCTGCGLKLGFRRYQFRGTWRIQGVYCKECMEKIAKNFDDSNTGITSLIKQKCSLCQNEFYFLREFEKKEKDSARYCSICFSTVKNSKVPISRLDQLQKGPVKQIPKQVLMAGTTGIVLMVGGLIFTFINTSPEGGDLVNILFGSATTFTGFIIITKSIQSRKLIYGQ
jgi:hypothetical protein